MSITNKALKCVKIACLSLLFAGVVFAQQTSSPVYGPTFGGNSSGGSSTTPGTGATISAIQLPHWIACTARVKMNTGNCRVYAIGDSTTWGSFAVNGSDTGDDAGSAYPKWLSVYLNSTILPAQRDSWMGNGTFAAPASITSGGDARVNAGGWVGTGVFSTGGAMLTATASVTPLAFLPLDNVDSFRVWYGAGPGNGVLLYSVDAGSTSTQSTNATAAVSSFVVSAGSVGSHTLHLNWSSGGAVFLIGVEAYNSTTHSVQVVNAGWPGATAANISNVGSGVYSSLLSVVTQAPDVVLLDIGINDWRFATSISSYTSQVQAAITAWKVNSDVVLVSPAPSSIATGTSLATQQLYVNALKSLAASNNIPFIDNFTRWTSYELKNPAPFLFYNEAIHPSANGYSDFAQSIASQLLSITGN